MQFLGWSLVLSAALGTALSAEEPSRDPLPKGAVRRLGAVRVPEIEQPWASELSRLRRLASSRDGGRLIGARDDRTVRVWDADSGDRIAFLDGHHGDVTAVALSPDGRLAGTGDDGNVILLWDVDSGKLLAEFEGHTGDISAVDFSPDGKLLASGDREGSVRLWDVSKRAAAALLGEHTGAVNALAFSNDGTLLSSADADGHLAAWDVAERRQLWRERLSKEALRCVAVGPDGTIVTAGEDGKLRAISGSAWNVRQIGDAGCTVRHLAFTAKGDFLVAADWEERIAVWNVVESRLAILFPTVDRTHGRRPILLLSIDRGTGDLTVGFTDGRPRWWSLHDAAGQAADSAHAGPVLHVAWDASGERLATASGADPIRVWNVTDGRLLGTLEGNGDRTARMGWVDGDRKIAALDMDLDPHRRNPKTAAIVAWDAASFRRIPMDAHPWDHPIGASFAPASIAVFRASGALELRDPSTLQLVRTLTPELRADDPRRRISSPYQPHSIALSPDGRSLAIGRGDKPPVLLDLPSAEFLELPPYPAIVASIAFSPDGALLCESDGISFSVIETATRVRFDWAKNRLRAHHFAPAPRHIALVASARSNYLQFLGLEDGEPIAEVRNAGGWITSLAWSPDGRHVATGLQDGSCLIWSTPAPRPPGKDSFFQRKAREQLASNDPSTAVAGARRLLEADPDEMLAFLLEVVSAPPSASTDARIAELARELDDEDPGKRRSAFAELAKLGMDAEPALRALAATPLAPEPGTQVAALLRACESSPVLAREPLLRLRALQTMHAWAFRHPDRTDDLAKIREALRIQARDCPWARVREKAARVLKAIE